MSKHATLNWRPLCAAALLLGLLQANWSPEAHAASLAAEAAIAAPVPVAAKKLITHDVYAGWKSVQGSVLSKNGEWAAYALVPQEDDGEVVFVRLADGKEWRSPRGVKPEFSADGRYAAFEIKPARKELDEAKKEKKKGDDAPKYGMGWIDLSTGQIKVLERVRQFAWPQEGGQQLAVLLEPAKDDKKAAKKEEKEDADGDTDQSSQNPPAASKKKVSSGGLLLIDAASGQTQQWEQVSGFAWAKNGSLLAFAVGEKKETTDKKAREAKETRDTKAQADSTAERKVQSGGATELAPGVYAWQADSRQVLTLLNGKGDYPRLKVDDAGTQVAFVSNRDDLAQKAAAAKAVKTEKAEDADKAARPAAGDKVSDKVVDKAGDKPDDKTDTSVYQLFFWKKGDHGASAMVGQNTAGMPAGWSVSQFGELSFSKDGQRLYLSTAKLPEVLPKDTPEPMKVDLWHWKDPELQSAQKAHAEKDRQKHYRALVWLSQGRFVQLANPDMPTVIINDNPRYALGVNDVPYKMLVSWDGVYRDAYAVDLDTGKAVLLAKKLRFMPTLSPAGKYVTAFDANSSQWLAWRTADANRIALTKAIKVRFEDYRQDTPEPRSAYGMAGWSKDDAQVVLYDEFDLWQVNPETLAYQNLTKGEGRRRHLQFRYLNLDDQTDKNEPEEDADLMADKDALPEQDWTLSALQTDTKASGFYRLPAKGGMPERLIDGPHMFGDLQRAKDAATVLYTRQSFTEFPDLWVGDKGIAGARQLTHANPQQSQYNWGAQELIEYTTTDGKKLKALLAKPENFDPSKKYPMMVYIYEKMTDNLNRYVPPAPVQNINITRYVSNGYIVLRPDIEYQTGHPGQSALKAVTGAVNKVVGMGFVDPQRIGIQGHSWGAYEINYIITQTNMFRAAEAGASMADMISGYGGMRWGKGVSRAFQYETGQSRMGGTPWNKKAEYIENSPIFYIDRVQTPYLTKHNDDDDAVPWYQAIEFFTAMRRLGKEAYWFNYNGEKHGLKDRENIKHYTVHMAEFFDHFLLGKARPEWMEKPVPYLERGRRDVSPQFKPRAEKASAEKTSDAH